MKERKTARNIMANSSPNKSSVSPMTLTGNKRKHETPSPLQQTTFSQELYDLIFKNQSKLPAPTGQVQFHSPRKLAPPQHPMETPISGLNPFDSPTPRNVVPAPNVIPPPIFKSPTSRMNIYHTPPSRETKINRDLLYANQYSAVIRPPLPLNKPEKESDQFIGKLYLEQKHFDHEKDILPTLQRIDPNMKYFVYGIDSSRHFSTDPQVIAIGRMDQGREFIDSIQNLRQRKKYICQMVIPYGGIPLSRMLHFNIEQFDIWFKELIEAIDILHDAQLVHQDIHINNILIDQNHARIIDFSVAMPMKDIFTTKNDDQLEQFSIVNPPEYSMHTHAYMTWVNALRQKDILEPYMKLHKISSEENLKKLYDRINKDGDFRHSDKIDIYSLGILFLSILHNNSTIYKKYEKTLRAMTIMDPRKRRIPKRLSSP